MTVYFADGTIISGSRAVVRRSIKVCMRIDPMPYWFSATKTEENYKKYYVYR